MMKCKVRSFSPMFWKFTTICFLFIPQEIPEAEQSYYLANIYSLLLEQDKNKGTKAPILSVKNQTEF